MREARDQRGAVVLLELVELAAVHDPRNDLPHVVGAVDVRGDDPVQVRHAQVRLPRGDHVPRRGLLLGQGGHDVPDDLQGVLVVLREVVGHTGGEGVQLTATQLLRGHLLPDGRLHERRAAQEDGALVAHDHGLVAHGGHVRAARGARAQHGGDLRDAAAGEVRLVVEDPPEVVPVREHLVLQWQERPAGVHQVHARQPVLRGDLLRPQMLLDRHGVVGAALHGGVVAHHHHQAAPDHPDPGDDPGTRARAVVHVLRGQGADLQERRALVQQPGHALARQQLAAGAVAFTALLGTAQGGPRRALTQLVPQPRAGLAVRAERGGTAVQLAREESHVVPSENSVNAQ